MPRRLPLLALLLGIALAAHAQVSRDTQRKLDSVRQELKQVAAERRRIEGQRGAASRELRAADERVGASTRALRETEAQLAQQQQALQRLQRQREGLSATLVRQRGELAQLLRAAYGMGEAAPLKLALSQDSVADANRVLTYHRYLQRDRAVRIATLRSELAQLDTLERQIAQARATLVAARSRQQTQITQLETDRKSRAEAVARLDTQFKDKQSREQALGRDARALEQVLAQLRAAARRAEAERRAAAKRQAAADKAASASRSGNAAGGKSGASRPKPPVVANAQPVRVGGLGWPLSGSLLAGFGGTLPDGRKSSGLLIAASAGTPVRAVANGKVVFSEWMNGYGLICIVDHGGGYLSLYAHNDALLRDVGADVKRGDPVASVGNSGGQGRPALYFELRRNGQPVNPASWLSAAR